MPRIRTIDASRLPPRAGALPGVSISPAAASAPGRALAAAAGAFRERFEFEEARQQKLIDGNLLIGNTNAFSRDLAAMEQKRKTEGDLTDPEFTRELLADAEARRQQLLDDLPKTKSGRLTISDGAKARLDRALQGMVTALHNRSVKLQGAAMTAQALDAIQTRVNQLDLGVRRNEFFLGPALDEVAELEDEFGDALKPNDLRDALGNARSDLIVSHILGRVDREDTEGARALLDAEEFAKDISPKQRDALTQRIAAAEKDNKLALDKRIGKARSRQSADFRLDLDARLRNEKVDFAALEAEVRAKNPAVLADSEKVFAVKMIRNEKARRRLALSEQQSKLAETERQNKLAGASRQAERGQLKHEDLPDLVTNGTIETNKELFAIEDKINANRPAFLTANENANLIVQNEGLVNTVLDRDTAPETLLNRLADIREFAVIAGLPPDQITFYDDLISFIRKRDKGIISRLDDAAYAGFVDRVRNARIEIKKGEITDIEATTTELLRFQADLVRARVVGQISEADMQFFLGKITPALEKQVEAETGLTFFGFGGGPEDVFDALFEMIDDIVDGADLEDAEALRLKTFLFRTGVFLADSLNVEGIEEPLERLKVQGEIAKMISAKFAGEIEPALKNLPPDQIPNALFLNGKVINIFSGVTKIPSERSIGQIETRRLADGRVVQVIKGTNIVIRVHDPSEDEEE